MIESPRDLFQKSCQKETKQLGLLLAEPWFKQVLIFAMAQLSHENTPQAKMEGANDFLTVLSNLSIEVDPLAGSLPPKDLKTY